MRRHPNAHAIADARTAVPGSVVRFAPVLDRPATPLFVLPRLAVACVAVALTLVAGVPVLALDPGDPLKINEVHYAPTESPQAAHEFIELYNAGSDTLYLDGAVITDEGNNGATEATFQFSGTPGGTTLPVPPGAFVLLVPDAIGSPYAGIDFEFFGGGADTDDPGIPNVTKTSGISVELTLGNGGDGITISNGQTTGNVIACGEVVDGVSWESGGSGDVTALSDSVCSDPSPHPGTADGPTSLQRCDDGSDTDDSAADFVVELRTPGAPNDCPTPPDVNAVTYAPCAPQASESVTITALIDDLNGDITGAQLFYKTEVALLFSVTSMVESNSGVYEADIPGALDQTVIMYYVQVSDTTGHLVTDPPGAPGSTHRYRVGVTDIATVQSATLADSCESSIYAGTPVNVVGTVTHHAREFSDFYFFMQQDTLANSGMRVFVADGSFQPQLGDRVAVSGTVGEFMCQTQLTVFPSCVTVEATGEPVLARQLGALTDVEQEENEGMLVTTTGPHEVLSTLMGEFIGGESFFEFRVGAEPDAIWVGADTFDPDNVAYTPPPAPGMILDALTGVVTFRAFVNADSTTLLHLEPRRDNDVDINYTGVPDHHETTVVGPLLLHQNHPNPFNPYTAIDFEVTQPGFVRLRVFDARGGLVRVLVSRRYAQAARGRALWDGNDARGRPVPSGVYVYRLESGTVTATRKMQLIR